MASWHRDASREIVDYARSNPPASAWNAGHIYEFAERLTAQRAGQLPRLGHANPDIRWWDFRDHVTVYLRVDVNPIQVLHLGRTATPGARTNCERVAGSRI